MAYSGPPPPQEFCCPITQCIMSVPVRASDGRIYEKDALSYVFDGGNTIAAIGSTITRYVTYDPFLYHGIRSWVRGKEAEYNLQWARKTTIQLSIASDESLESSAKELRQELKNIAQFINKRIVRRQIPHDAIVYRNAYMEMSSAVQDALRESRKYGINETDKYRTISKRRYVILQCLVDCNEAMEGIDIEGYVATLGVHQRIVQWDEEVQRQLRINGISEEEYLI